MTRKLILMRHAHAELASSGQSDAQRPLSRSGQGQALAAGDWLRAQSIVPDRILCSPALRARETLASVMTRSMGDSEKLLEPAIYQANVPTLLSIIEVQAADASCILLIGHNPALEQLCGWLCHQSPAQGNVWPMPPSSVVVLALPPTNELIHGSAKLLAMWKPG